MNRDALLEALNARLAAVLDPLLDGVRSCALLDFPQHGNVGDSAIWLGERAFLAQRGIQVDYICDTRSWRPDALRAEVLLLSGGGNLGDLYVRHQRLREQVIAAFPSRRIIQLPQTIRFLNDACLQHTRQVFDSHPDLTILVRDAESLACARRHFAAPTHLAPDMAFALGALAPPTMADTDVVWLARTDRESSGAAYVGGPGVRMDDWLIEPGRPPAVRAFDLLSRLARRPLGGGAAAALNRLADPIARMRLRRGAALLSGGRVVVTDRLHGHILSVLLGLPHVVLGDRHGKVRGFWEAWTNDYDLATWAATPEDALEAARRLCSQPS